MERSNGMNNNIPEERRKHIRVPVKFLPLIDISPNENPNLIFEGNIVEISEGGVLIQLPDFEIANFIPPLKSPSLISSESEKLKNYKFWLNFSLPPKDNRIKALAQLIRVQEHFQLAMRFLEISDPDRIQIQKFVHESEI